MFKFLKMFFFLLIILKVLISAEVKNSQSRTLTYTPSISKFNINRISTFIYNNGIADKSPDDNAGFIFPKENGGNIFYQSGFMWGGIVDSQLRVGGSHFVSGLVPGKILNEDVNWEDLTTEDPNSEETRVYRVRPDYKTSTLQSEIEEGEGSYAQVYDQYEKDWNEWRAEDGAPFDDVDGNGVYDPEIDIPGVPEADQTLWFVANDVDSNSVKSLFGSKPIGIEMQTTVWGYDRDDELGNALFKKYTIINKSDKTIEDLYLSMWNDPDIGNSEDDLVGWYGIPFAYNGNEIDSRFGKTPPASSFFLLEGVEKDNMNYNQISHYLHIEGDPVFKYPELGNYPGSKRMYNYFQGKNNFGELFTDFATGYPTTFVLSGNPITGESFKGRDGEGAIDDKFYPPGERAHGIGIGKYPESSTPGLAMAPGDSMSLVFAQTAAIGNGRLESYKNLIYNSRRIKERFSNKLFNSIPKLPAIALEVDTLNGDFVLTWSSEKSDSIESFSEDGFEFQGYIVYGFTTQYGVRENGKVLKIFDKIDGVTAIRRTVPDPSSGEPIWKDKYKGTDSGINRSCVIEYPFDQDNFMPGDNYYFSVAAYAYNSDANPDYKVIESENVLVEVETEETIPFGETGDTLKVIHTNGISEADVVVTVENPYLATGHQYKINFDTTSTGKLFWRLIDETEDKVVFSDSSNSEEGSAGLVDGLKIEINGSKSLKTISKIRTSKGIEFIKDSEFWQSSSRWFISDPFLQKNFASAATKSSFGYGSEDLDLLSHDYQLIWNGIQKDTVINGKTVKITKSGGSMVTVAGAENFSLADHPLNPNPGSNDPFLVRVPFEVWDKTLGVQINAELFYNEEDLSGSPFYVWLSNWGYSTDVNFLNTPYNTDRPVNGSIGGSDTAYYTWSTSWHIAAPEPGEIVTIEYDYPLQPGIDEFIFSEIVSSVEDDKIAGEDFYLDQNYPNPFNPTTKINYRITDANFVEVEVFNILGERVKTLVNEFQKAGNYSLDFRGGNLSSGVYIYTLKAGEYFSSRKMILIK